VKHPSGVGGVERCLEGLGRGGTKMEKAMGIRRRVARGRTGFKESQVKAGEGGCEKSGQKKKQRRRNGVKGGAGGVYIKRGKEGTEIRRKGGNVVIGISGGEAGKRWEGCQSLTQERGPRGGKSPVASAPVKKRGPQNTLGRVQSRTRKSKE